MHYSLNHPATSARTGLETRPVRLAPVVAVDPLSLGHGDGSFPAALARGWGAAVVVSLCLVLAGCDGPVSSASSPSTSESGAERLVNREVRAKQAAVLNQIRQADPEFRTIDRALLNEHNELGLILDRTVELDRIPALMRQMLTKMAVHFPGEDLTVLAYTPSTPPHKVGTARLNARTRDMTYTPE